MINFSQIQTFLEVAQTGSFAEASRRLSVPRSTVSARVSALEDQLNVRLLHRTTRRVTPTDEGQRFIEICQDSINRLMEAEAEFSRTDVLSGTIRITVPIDMPKPWLAKLLSDFVKHHPLVQIEVIITDETLDLVASNIDLALRGGAPGSAGLVARKLGMGKLALYASAQYVAEKVPAGALDSLSGHVVFDPSRRGRELIDADAPRPRIETHNFELAKALAIQSQGLALLPSTLCAAEEENGQLIAIEFRGTLPSLALYVVIPSRHHVPRRVRALIDLLVAEQKRSETA